MKKMYFRLLSALVIVLVIAGAKPAHGQAPTWAWANAVPNAEGTQTATDGAGNVYVTGNFRGTATFGPTTLTSAGGTDVFVAQYSAAGLCQWAVGAGSTGDEFGADIAIDAAGGVYIIGDFKGSTSTFGSTMLTNGTPGLNEIFVAKLNASRQWQWAVRAGGPNSDLGRGIALDTRGDVVISGSAGSPTAQFGSFTLNVPLARDAFVAKLDAAGTWQWVAQGGGTEMDFGYGLAVDGADNIFLTGYFRSPVATFGPHTLISAGVGDAYVARLSPAGVWEWVRRAGGATEDNGQGLALDRFGNVYIAGYLDSPIADFGPFTLTNSSQSTGFVAKLDPTGTWQWATQAGTSGLTACFGLALTAADIVHVSGLYAGSSLTLGTSTLVNQGAIGTFDFFIAQLTTAGAWLSATGAGGTGNDLGLGLSVSPTGAPTITGGFASPALAFGATTLLNPSAPTNGCFVAQLAPGSVGLPNETTTTAFTLSPNPAQHHVRLTGAAAPNGALFDNLGRTVRRFTTAAGAATLDVTGLAPGIYTVRVGASARRLVVE